MRVRSGANAADARINSNAAITVVTSHVSVRLCRNSKATAVQIRAVRVVNRGGAAANRVDRGRHAINLVATDNHRVRHGLNEQSNTRKARTQTGTNSVI